MKPFVPYRPLDALIKTVLIFATIHLVALAIYAVMTFDYTPLNLFYVLQLHIFFPEIVQGSSWFVVGVVVLAIVYSVVYTYFSKDKE